MNTQKTIFALCLGVLFVGLNVYFIANDEEGKIQRTPYVSEWSVVEEKTLQTTMRTDGVFDYVNEQYVYFDDRLGRFDRFSVRVGDVIEAGDELYTYHVDNYVAAKAELDQELARLEEEIASLEAALTETTSYPLGTPHIDLYDEENESLARIEYETPGADWMKEQYRMELDLRLKASEAQLASVEATRTELDSGKSTVAVESPYDGRVAALANNLENPLVTIESAELYVRGELTEKERMDVSVGMKAQVALANGEEAKKKQTLSGVVSKIDHKPTAVDLEADSLYPFHISLKDDEPVKDIMPGYHTNIELVLQEAIDTRAIPEDSLFDSVVWRLGKNGQLVRHQIEAGMKADGYVEVQADDQLAVGDWVVAYDDAFLRNRASFITPLRLGEYKWKQLKDEAHKKRSMFIGFLAR